MKCNICNQKMEHGFLQTSGARAAWTKTIRMSIQPKQGEVLLENNLFSAVNFTAYL